MIRYIDGQQTTNQPIIRKYISDQYWRAKIFIYLFIFWLPLVLQVFFQYYYHHHHHHWSFQKLIICVTAKLKNIFILEYNMFAFFSISMIVLLVARAIEFCTKYVFFPWIIFCLFVLLCVDQYSVLNNLVK